MHIEFLSVVLAVVSLLLLAVPGFLMQKAKFLPEKSTETISNLVLYACQTAMVFMGFQNCKFTVEIGVNMLIIGGIFCAFYITSAVIACLIVRKKDGEMDTRNVIRYSSVFGNCGFMGLPFLIMLFEPQGKEVLGEVLVYGATIIAIHNILNWTLGAYLMTGDRKSVSVKKIIFNPVVIAIVLGFLVFVIAKQPVVDLAVQGSALDDILEKLMGCIDNIGATVTPLSMTVIGIKLANIKFKSLITSKWAYIACFLKLILGSLLAIAIIAFLPVSLPVKYVFFFLAAMPCATSSAMFAVTFKKDADTASIAVLLSTILSTATTSLLFLLFNMLVTMV